jgi:hypothetical protein
VSDAAEPLAPAHGGRAVGLTEFLVAQRGHGQAYGQRKQMWKRLYNRLTIERTPATARYEELPKPTLAALNQYEAATGFKLPLSYRKFIRVFGPGIHAHYYFIRAPGYWPDFPNKSDANFDLLRFYERCRDAEFIDQNAAYHHDREFVSRMVPFCTSFHGDVIVWDPKDIQDAKRREYGLYALMDNYKYYDSPIKLSNSFAEWILDIYRGKGLYAVYGEPDLIPLTFEPIAKARQRLR